MSTYHCSSCRRPIAVVARCPHCGAEQGQWAEELARVERAIAEMKARDAALLREQAALAAKLQAAIFQRDVLAHVNRERLKEETRPRSVLRRLAQRRPPRGARPHIPRQAPPRREEGPPPAVADARPTRAETSPRGVQNILLGLGALLLAVPAVVFAAVAGDVARIGMLAAATVLMLGAAPPIARRGLTATAETVAAVGLLLVVLDGYALWTVDQVRSGPLSGPVFAGLTFVATAAIAAGYGALTGLSVPRYATVLALQPVLPLLAYRWIAGATGWALALTAVATLDLWLGRQLTRHGRLAPRPRVRAAGAAGDRPSAVWLRRTTWALHGLAVAAALAYAVTALFDATTVPAATRTGVVLLLAATVGLAGARAVRQPPLPDLLAGVLTLSIIVAAGRVAAVAFPARSLLLVAAIIALTSAGVAALPRSERQGPQLASAVALVLIGAVVAASTVRAAVAPIRAALPPWNADLSAHPQTLASAVGSAAWQLAATALLLTVAATLSLPHGLRREFSVVGAALTALAAPASFGLAWWAAPWPPVLTAVGIGVAGLGARTARAAQTHAVAAAVVGLAGAGASLARPGLTAAVLAVLTVAGVLVALTAAVGLARPSPSTEILAAWAAGGAAFAFPGAAAAAVVAGTLAGSAPTLAEAATPALAASFLATCVTLSYASITQVSKRQIDPPLAVGTGLGATAVAAAAFVAPGATAADAWIGILIVAAVALLVFTRAIDVRRRADRLFDGADYAAAAAALVTVGTLARVAGILAPDAAMALAAGLVLLAAAGARALPPEWRRGPNLGITVGGGLIALTASVVAVRGGVAVLMTPGGLWRANLDEWPIATELGGWQVPVALVLLAAAAAIALPRPWAYDVAGALVALATVGTPAALGLPWWSPILVGCGVATGYALAAVVAADPRAGLTRAVVAVAVALHALATSLVRPWSTAAALGLVAVVGFVVAALSRITATLPDDPTDGGAAGQPAVGVDPMPAHLALIGGVATTVTLLALPGSIAALAAALGWPAETVLTAALATLSLSVALVGLVRPHVPHYLPYATVGVAVGATAVAVTSLLTELPTGIYAAAAVLLGVLVELLRVATVPPGATEPVRRWSARLGRSLQPGRRSYSGWSVSPATGMLAAAALPTALAVAALAPALRATLVAPYELPRIWQGPSAALAEPPAEAVSTTNVAAALLLTIAAALAVTGLNGRRPAHAVPVILPGAAVTLLITPISLGQPWPASTFAALSVFTVAMLGLALTPPPRSLMRNRPIRIARRIVFGIGLAGGGAGFAGSLASRELTLLTLAGAVAVGTVAALAGRTQHARILGWLFAAVMAHGLVLTVGLQRGVEPEWSAFGVLAVGAALLLATTMLPPLRRPEALRERVTVEWSSYGSALVALAMAYDSPRHVAALLAAWGAVLGAAAVRPALPPVRWRVLFWGAVVCEITAWWMTMYLADVALLEAYTLPFAAFALLVGMLELRRRPDLNSWLAYSPALVAALLPTLALVIATNTSNLRQVLLLLGAVATLIVGSARQQQAPVVIGAVVTAVTALHALTLVGPWLLLIPVGFTLLALGASRERRRRAQDRLRAVRDMR